MIIRFTQVSVSDDEREAFLTKNALPKNDKESWVWWVVENSHGLVPFYLDELPLAAKMARQAGLNDLAQRIEQAD